MKIFKFADDVDIITTTDNHDKIPEELQRIESWAAENNLVLNKSKTKKIVFHNRGEKPRLPPPMDGIDRVAKFRKLGVILQETLSMKEHVNDVLADCTNMLYAMNILRSQGLPMRELQLVFNAKILSKIVYASLAWWGLMGREELLRIDSFLRCAKKTRLLSY